MSILTGHLAIMERIATMPDAPNIVWPDGPGADAPRYVMQGAGGAQQTRTLAGLTQADPEVVVRVETKEGSYANANNALVNALVARFPVNLRFSGLVVLQAPDVRPPLLSGGVYAVPVIIRARFHF